MRDKYRMKTRKLFKENSDMPLKKVVIAVFTPLTDDIPAPLIRRGLSGISYVTISNISKPRLQIRPTR